MDKIEQRVIFSKHNVYTSKKKYQKETDIAESWPISGYHPDTILTGGNSRQPHLDLKWNGGKKARTSTRQIIRPLGRLNNIEQNTEDIFCRGILRINVQWEHRFPLMPVDYRANALQQERVVCNYIIRSQTRTRK